MKEQKENLFPLVSKVNVNNYCYVDLTSNGRDVYEQHYSQLRGRVLKLYNNDAKLVSELVRTPKLEIVPDGARFQLWELMKIFGSAFSDDYTKAPFTNVVINLDSQVKQVIGLNDPVLVILTKNGENILKNAFDGHSKLKTNGPFTEISFDRLMHFFHSEMYLGNTNESPFHGNNLYLLKPMKTLLPASV